MYYTYYNTAGVQNKSPQEAPAWYADCSEQKATLATDSGEATPKLLFTNHRFLLS